ncbi:MAG: TlpA disulfide reductase family protein [Bacteroidota bacterium]
MLIQWRSLVLIGTLLLSGWSLSAQPFDKILLQGQLTEWDEDTIRLFIPDGVSLRPVTNMVLNRTDRKAQFAVSFNKVPPGIYFLGTGKPGQSCQVLLGLDSVVQVVGTQAQFAQARVISPKNARYQQILSQYNSWQQEFKRLLNGYRTALARKTPLDGIKGQFEAFDKKQLDFVESLRQTDPQLAQVAALRTYLSYQSQGEGYQDEADYLGKTYFQLVDFQDPFLNRLPLLHESFKGFASNLGGLNLFQREKQAYADMWLNAIPQPSSAHKAALLGLAAGFRKRNEDGFAHYINRYLEQYGNDNPLLSNQLRKEYQTLAFRLIGEEAPDLKFPTPEGDSLAMSDLRGKLLLVDFWASWCGPCRRENPRVKAMYDKYKDQGFEILGVSLDNNHGRWVQAIKADQLPWYHISDLKQWRSAAARTYGVGSIPFTLLVDEEGRILEKGLRGAKLEARVAEILAEQATAGDSK